MGVTTLPEQLRRGLTSDRGQETAQHVAVTIATDMTPYFCDPKAPWQRGTNENLNVLLRDYFPKRTDLTVHPQARLDAVADQLNTRPPGSPQLEDTGRDVRL